MAKIKSIAANIDSNEIVEKSSSSIEINTIDSLSHLLEMLRYFKIEDIDENVEETSWTLPDTAGVQYKIKTKVITRSQRNSARAERITDKIDTIDKRTIVDNKDSTTITTAIEANYKEKTKNRSSPSMLVFIPIIIFLILYKKSQRW